MSEKHYDEQRYTKESFGRDLWDTWQRGEQPEDAIIRNAARTAQLKRLLEEANERIAKLEARLDALEKADA